MNTKTLIVATLSAVVLAGCASTPEETESKTSDLQSVLDESTDGSSLKEVGYATLRKQQPDFTAGVSDSDIDEIAEATCSAWDAGATPEDMVLAAIPQGLDGETGSVMMLAAMVYCPEYKDLVDEWMETYG